MQYRPNVDIPQAFLRFRQALVLTLFIGAIVGGLAGGFIAKALMNPGFVVRQLEQYSPPVPTRLLDVKGRVIASFFAEKREIVPYHEMPAALVQALLNTEDEHFESHYGFNVWRIMKAAFIDIITLSKDQGGSTITLQLSRGIFLSHRKTLTRKVQELWYALQMERLYTKQEILWYYLNQVNFGHGCYGVEAASQFYFHKHVRDLSIPECALLAGIPKSPTYYSPLKYPKNAMSRHRLVLHNMASHGHFSRTQANLLHEDFWLDFLSKTRSINATASEVEDVEAPFFVELVRKDLEKRFDRDTLYKGGLTVYTTLNLDHQRSAERLLKEKLDEQNRTYKFAMKPINEALDIYAFEAVEAQALAMGLPIPTSRTRRQDRAKDLLAHEGREPIRVAAMLMGNHRLYQVLQNQALTAPAVEDEEEKAEGAFISMDPATGHITAMVGGSHFQYYNQFNRVLLARRQLGSAIKPFIYAPALDKRVITPATPLSDAPIAFGAARAGEDELYVPKNYDGDYKGTIPAREALRRSVNTCALLILEKIGSDTVKEYAKRFFRIPTDADMARKFPPDVTMGLGTGSFTPMEIVQAYGVFANEGREVLPLMIRSVHGRRGESLTNLEQELAKQPRRQVISPAVAFLITDILRGVFDGGGTANRKELDNYKQRYVSSGKTGTTGNWTDAWFVGYVRQCVAAVWIGYDSNKSLGRGKTGGDMSAPIWIDFMKESFNKDRIIPWRVPGEIVTRRVSFRTGKLESPATTDGYKEFFIAGTEPTEYDDSKQVEARDQQNFLDLVNRKKRTSRTPPSPGATP